MAICGERTFFLARLYKQQDGDRTPSFWVSLTVKEYRHQQTNNIIGTKPFNYNDETASAYIRQALEWWDGRRPTRGVDIEEAYKCRSCDFEEGCVWRISKIEELAAKRLNRNKSLMESPMEG